MERALVVTLFTLIVFTASCSMPGYLPMREHADHFRPDPSSENGHIYIYREAEHGGSFRGIYILADGKRIGGVNTGTYFVYPSKPGPVEIAAENTLDSDDMIKRVITVEQGKSYYLRANMRMGFWDGKPYVEIVNELEGSQAVAHLKYKTFDPTVIRAPAPAPSPY